MEIRTQSTRIPQAAAEHHPLLPGAAIAVLSLLLAVGLDAMGTLNFFDQWLANQLSSGKVFPQILPAWVVWITTCSFAFGVSYALLHIMLMWQRWLVWITALGLALGWAPVLTLADYFPRVGPLVVVTFWSGICALVYTARHEKVITPHPSKPTP